MSERDLETSRRGALSPHVRLALLRLGTQARMIRDSIATQAAEPGKARRNWTWIRASLPGELDLAMVHGLHALQALHDAVFGSPELVPVREIRRRVATMNDCIDHMLGLHRDVAAAFPPRHPARAAVLAVIERPLLQLADFFEAIRAAVSDVAVPGCGKAESDVELQLSIDLDFAAQLSAAESVIASSASLH